MEKDTKAIWDLLEQVFDPEIPVLTVVDMGVIRAITFHEDQLEIVMIHFICTIIYLLLILKIILN